MIAYCYRTGLIKLGSRLPKGAIEIARGKAKAVRSMVDVTSRHAYDGVSYLVPGVPEAETEDAAVEALIAHRNWIASHNYEGVICQAV